MRARPGGLPASKRLWRKSWCSLAVPQVSLLVAMLDARGVAALHDCTRMHTGKEGMMSEL